MKYNHTMGSPKFKYEHELSYNIYKYSFSTQTNNDLWYEPTYIVRTKKLPWRPPTPKTPWQQRVLFIMQENK